MLADNKSKKSPLIAEIVGPAGVGKTTVLSALHQCNEEIRPLFGFRRKGYVPFYAGHAILLLPFFLRQGKTGRWYTWREMNRMIRLKATRQILERRTVKEGLITVVDQGPVYTLTVLAGFGSECTKGQCFVNWWGKTLKEWAKTLDLIIWLDAPDEVLLERIRNRDKRHLVKDKSDQEAIDFLAQCRTVYKQIIGKLAVDGGPKVLCYDTSQCPLTRIVEDILTALNLPPATRSR